MAGVKKSSFHDKQTWEANMSAGHISIYSISVHYWLHSLSPHRHRFMNSDHCHIKISRHPRCSQLCTGELYTAILHTPTSHQQSRRDIVNCAVIYWHHLISVKCLAKLIQKTSYTDPFNGSLSGTTQVSRYQKGKTNLDFTEARDSGWQWHQLAHDASLHLAPDRQPHQHPTTLMFFTGRMPFLPPNQQCQSTEGKSTEGNCE